MPSLATGGISAQNPRRPKRLELLLVGPVGTRKTVTAHQMPNTRTLDFDDGMQSVEWAILAKVLPKRLDEIVYETLHPRNVQGKLLEEVMSELLNAATDHVDRWIEEEDIPPDEWAAYCTTGKGAKYYEGVVVPQFWDTLIVDSASFMMDTAVALGLLENKRIKMSESIDNAKAGVKRTRLPLTVVPMRIQDWGSAGTLFLKAVRQWRGLGKNLIITAHEYHLIDEDTGSLVAIQPNVVGQLRSKLPASVDEVWYAKAKPKADRVDVVFRVQQEVKREAKTRLGCIGPEEDANFLAIRKKVAEFYGVPEESLWRAYHGQAGREQAERELAEESMAV